MLILIMIMGMKREKVEIEKIEEKFDGKKVKSKPAPASSLQLLPHPIVCHVCSLFTHLYTINIHPTYHNKYLAWSHLFHAFLLHVSKSVAGSFLLNHVRLISTSHLQKSNILKIECSPQSQSAFLRIFLQKLIQFSVLYVVSNIFAIKSIAIDVTEVTLGF